MDPLLCITPNDREGGVLLAWGVLVVVTGKLAHELACVEGPHHPRSRGVRGPPERCPWGGVAGKNNSPSSPFRSTGRRFGWFLSTKTSYQGSV
jgi:hypothetical protein